MNKVKICSKCGVSKPTSSFGKNASAKDSLTSGCKACKSLANKKYAAKHKTKIAEYQRRWRESNKESIKIKKKAEYEKDRDRILARTALYALGNKCKIKKYQQEYNLLNKASLKVQKAIWQKGNPDKCNAISAKRHTAKLQANPYHKSKSSPWEGKELSDLIISEAYSLAQERTKLTGIKHQVDHIIPLQGVNVCGLHVGINLQVITALANQSKSNKFDNKHLLN